MSSPVLAIDAASSRLSVALGLGDAVESRHIDGPRRHAGAVLVLIDELLAPRDLAPRDLQRIVTGDGPGSFTGLRVAAAVAKALAWGRDELEWWTAPSLLARIPLAVQASRQAGTVLALSDALRGELYAGCWRLADGIVTMLGPSPRAMTPEQLAGFGAVDHVIGTIPEPLMDRVRGATGREPVTGDDALPDAANLIALLDRPGGARRVADAATWRPEYGRPAEAQAVWERKHGRPLPDPSAGRG
ncbi:MAG TPA: tRNA (adenosine(37)-N6)-threonylcarbamoyltransferase complex dimerization subunit type 1 TsaB [Gemmatimonadales bacterium]|nr:tRNA (adenosine(37)-N6)-threonylcarbamoyltransferase complex dimerization subunit type 1 TsaB [Gemmatimonadales bacterium]